MSNDISVLIYSCDSYSDVWYPFFTLFFKYWNCPYQVYLTTESKECEWENVITLNTTGEKWTDRIRKAVEKIPTKYVIGMCEDMFFRRPVRQKIIDYCYWEMEKNPKIVNFNFEKTLTPTEESVYDNFSRRVCRCDYQCSCQPTLWRKDKLLELLSGSQDPWEWEMTEVSPDDYYYVWTGSEDELVFEYGYHQKWFGIQKGKWVFDDVRPLFIKEGIQVDFTKRGYV